MSIDKNWKDFLNEESEHLGYWSKNSNDLERNPQDLEYWLEQIEGMSLDDAIYYLGKQGLPSSQAKAILDRHDTEIQDMFHDFSREEDPFPSDKKGIDQLDKDDLYEYSDEKGEYDDAPWARGSGWNEEYFYELLHTLDDTARLQYEIKNAIRGSYALRGDHIDDMIEYVKKIIEELKDFVEYN